MTFALPLIVKATLVIALAMVGGWLTRRRRAALRHLMFVSAFAVLALLPVATAVLPAIPVRLPAMPATEAAAPTPLIPVVDTVMAAVGRTSVSQGASVISPVRVTFTLMAVVWLVGAGCCLVPVTLGLWQIRRVRHQGVEWRDAQNTANDLALHAGFGRPIDVLVHEALDGPMTCGVGRPAILFPPDARTWPEVDVRRALTHELEHIRRRDWITLCLARVICAFYWFHPLVWIANRQLSVNAERACDDAVLRECHAFGYADQLVALAERSLERTRRPLLAMSNRGDLSTRVHAVLNAGQQRGPAGVWARIAVGVAAAASVALLAPLRTTAGAAGQAPSTAALRFEVTSVKPHDDVDRIMNVRPLPGRLTADATLQVLMQYAYGVAAFQIVGGPDWLASARYEIDATAGGAATRDQIFLMLQSLLEDRFRLKTHRETREMSLFTLAVNGSLKLPPPKEGACVNSAVDAALEWVGNGRMAAPGELPPARSRCGSAIVALGPGGAHLTGEIPMSELVRALSMLSARSVVDKTGYTAVFDARLDFVPDDTTPGVPPPPSGTDIRGVSIAQALREQLGLRLEPSKGPVEVIVVDRAERPRAN